MNLKHLIANAQQIPNIPKIVEELIESFDSEVTKSQEIADSISKDQALTARVLRMANSAHYGGHRKVGSMNDAVVLLGFNSLRTLILSSSLTGAIKLPVDIDIKNYWYKSFMVGSLCKWVAKNSQLNEDIAFICGMLHDIGGLLIHILDRDQALAIDALIKEGGERAETENDYLGFNFTEAGAELAMRWKFPDYIVESIRYQLEPDKDGEKPYARIVKIGAEIYPHIGNTEITQEQLPCDDIEALGLSINTIVNNFSETNGFADSIKAVLQD